MSTKQITGRTLLDRGWQPGPAVGAALAVSAEMQAAGATPDDILDQLGALYANPDAYQNDPVLGEAAALLIQQAGTLTPRASDTPKLRASAAPLSVWGRELIDDDSFRQINDAARLPVTLKVALMPDAHIGYGLPIGGVAALEGAIAPYMVGVDIGCRMHATVFRRNPALLVQKPDRYQSLLLEHTYFGLSTPPRAERNDHPILDDPRWDRLPHKLGNLKDLAAEQLGTSGGGNHFVEWAAFTVLDENPLGLDLGDYIVLVSHSGSRGPGFKIANYYSQMAENLCHFLPKQMRKLGYLDYQAGDGMAYEEAMQLAGDFARANHEVIHQRITDAYGADLALATVQNHHNFAWRATGADGQPVFIHRKGATPAEAGALGIIPGSMATPGFFVEGRCYEPARVLEHPSLNSAAHGSGRVLGRRQAIRSLDAETVRRTLANRGVTLLGGGLDEAPDAYKDSRRVIAAQSDLVRVWAEFRPKIVRMADDGGRALGIPTGDKGWRRRGRKKDKRRKR